MFKLLEQCRGLPELPEPAFRLLELIVEKLDGPWDIHETPTIPLRHTPSPFGLKK